MQRRVGVLFATTLLIFFVLAAGRMRAAAQADDKQAAINVALANERAVQENDFDKVDSLYTPDARVIEESYPCLLYTSTGRVRRGPFLRAQRAPVLVITVRGIIFKTVLPCLLYTSRCV